MLLHSCGGRIINPVGHKDILNAVARNQARHAPARRHGQKNHCDKKSRSHPSPLFLLCARAQGRRFDLSPRRATEANLTNAPHPERRGEK